MNQRNVDDTETARENAIPDANRPHDDRNLFEKARDSMANPAERRQAEERQDRSVAIADADADTSRRVANDASGDAPSNARPAPMADVRAATDDAGEAERSILPSDKLSGFQSRWQEIQIEFVDEPRTAVRDAEALVGDVVAQLTDLFTQERNALEQNWNSGSEVSTEDLRVTLQRYRSFFQRLLAA